jgi:hypothetical protein
MPNLLEPKKRLTVTHLKDGGGSRLAQGSKISLTKNNHIENSQLFQPILLVALDMLQAFF